MKRYTTSLLISISLLLAAATPAFAGSLDKELVRAAMIDQARRSLPDTVVEVDVQDVQVRGSVDVPSRGDVTVRIRAEGDEDWIGRVSAEAEILVDGRSIERVRILGDVVAFVEVAVIQTPIARGHRLVASDVGSTRRDANSLPAGLVVSPTSLVGRIAKRNLSLNQLVTESDLVERMDAERNHPVTLLVRTGSLTLTAPGVLRKDARIGDLVEVLSTATRSNVYGILLTPDLVEVPTVKHTTTQPVSAR